MKILIQHPHRDDEISGVLTSIRELVPELAARPGIEVRLLSTRTASLREQLHAVRAADALMLNSNCLFVTLVGRLLRRPVVLKLHYVQYQTVHYDYVAMPFGRRIRVELGHLLQAHSSPRYKAEAVGRLILRTVVGLLADRVCACSRFCAEQASLPRPVSVLPNPIRIAPDRPARVAAQMDCPHRLVFIGRITRDKGWDTLVEAAALVAEAGRDFRIDVIGDGDDLGAMRERVAALGLSERFGFAGRLAPAATHARLGGALAALMPSRSQETAGYIPLEAAAQQVASIVSRVGGLPETAGPHGLLHAPGSAAELAAAMLRFLDDPQLAMAAGRAAYLRAADEFAPRRVADELLRLFGTPALPHIEVNTPEPIVPTRDQM